MISGGTWNQSCLQGTNSTLRKNFGKTLKSITSPKSNVLKKAHEPIDKARLQVFEFCLDIPLIMCKASTKAVLSIIVLVVIISCLWQMLVQRRNRCMWVFDLLGMPNGRITALRTSIGCDKAGTRMELFRYFTLFSIEHLHSSMKQASRKLRVPVHEFSR